MSNIIQRSFAGGEIAPALYARTDQVKYATGLRTCRNMIVQRHGGVANRPGTEFVCEVKDSTKQVRLIEFIFNASEALVLECGNKYIRFISDGSQVVIDVPAAWVTATDYEVGDLVTNGGVNYYCTTDHTSAAATEPGVGIQYTGSWYALEADIYEIPTPYIEADLDDLQYVQSADVITIVHPSYPPYELRRYGPTDWQLVKIVFGPTLPGPVGLALTGGNAGGTAYYAVTSVKDGSFEESTPSFVSKVDAIPSETTPTEVGWDAVEGAIEYNVYRSDDGRTYGFIGTSGGTPTTQSDTTWTNDTILINATGPGETISPTFADNDLDLTNGKAFDGKYRGRADLNIFPAAGPQDDSQVSGTVLIYYSRDGEPRVYATQQTFEGSGTFDVDFSFNVPDNGYTTLKIEFQASIFIGDSKTWDLSFLASSVQWGGSTTGFSDPKITPDYSLAPPTQQSIFDSVDNYPSVVAYYQQRLFFANTNSNVEKVWASKIGNFPNFSISTPLQDDDSISFVLAGRQVNAVHHLLDLGTLIVFTLGSEGIVEGGQDGIIRPSEINPRQYTYNGSKKNLRPLIVVNSALYVQGKGTIVRDLVNSKQEGYNGNDLTIFAHHLFRGRTLVDWTYQQTPNSIVWAVRDDGKLVALTYLKEQEVWGWHRHDTDGLVENVCSIPEGEEDRLYMVVQRTINGSAVRYIERMRSRYFIDVTDAFFVDCGLSYDGTNTGATTVTLTGGVDWTNGEDLTLTASAATFDAGDVGNEVQITDADGSLIRCEIRAFVSATVVTVKSDRNVPETLQGIAVMSWALAADTLSGLDHLEGKSVSVFADGFVVASPNNSSYGLITVAGGSITLSRPYAKVHVGLPFISDLETLDIDTSRGQSLKDKNQLIGAVGIGVEDSRGIFVGSREPTGDDPLDRLEEYKARFDESYDDPVALQTGTLNVPIDSDWNSNGRIFIRQVDPLPLTIQSVMPQGFLP